MADLLQTGSDWLEGQRVKHLTRSVIYQRGTSRVEVSATIGRTVFEVDDGFGVFERIESRDYLILVQDLVFNGQPAIPQPGDRILEADGSRTIVYEVMAPGREPHWRYSDPYRKTLRIHTKQVEEQA